MDNSLESLKQVNYRIQPQDQPGRQDIVGCLLLGKYVGLLGISR